MKKPKEFINRLGELLGEGVELKEAIKMCFKEWNKVLLESNLDKAKRLYGEGVRFRNIKENDFHISKGEIFEGFGRIWCKVDGFLGASIFYEGKWAEIVEPTEQAIEDKLYCLIWDDNGSFFDGVSKIYTNKGADAMILSYNNLSKITLREAIERKIIEL